MATTVKFVSVPSKTLAASINASAYSIQLSDIKGWDGNNLSSANFGDVLWCVLRDSTNTFMEIMKLDPTTIANSSVTVLARGLDFSGGSAEVTANKLTWIKNDTIVELGTNPPQLLNQAVCVSGPQTIADLKTFTTLPQCTAVPSVPGDLVNKAYADALAIAGAPNASTSVQGLVQEATQAQTDARTTTGSTGAKLFVPLDKRRSTFLSDYVASDTGSVNAFAIAPTPTFTSLVAGQRYIFKAANTNTAAATVAVNGLTAKTIKKYGSIDLAANDILSGQIVEVIYDGTNMQMISPIAATVATGTVMAFAGVTAPTGFLLCDASAVSRTTYSALFSLLNPSLGTVTVTLASPGVFSFTAHGLVEGDTVFLTTTGALPTGLSANTLYYVIATGLTANAFELSATRGGSAINTSVSQSGTHTLWRTLHGLGDGSTTFNVPSLKGKVIVGRDGSDTQFSYGQTGGEKTHVLTIAELASHSHLQNFYTSGSATKPSQSAGSANATASNSVLPATDTAGSDTAHNNLQPYNSMHYIIKI